MSPRPWRTPHTLSVSETAPILIPVRLPLKVPVSVQEPIKQEILVSFFFFPFFFLEKYAFDSFLFLCQIYFDSCTFKLINPVFQFLKACIFLPLYLNLI